MALEKSQIGRALRFSACENRALENVDFLSAFPPHRQGDETVKLSLISRLGEKVAQRSSFFFESEATTQRD